MSGSLDKTSDIFRWVELGLKSENVYVTEVCRKGNTQLGDGYTGQVIFVHVKAIKNEKIVNYNLVIKKSVQDEKSREILNVKLSYERETYTYCTVLPIFREFEVKKGLKPFESVPKCYGGYTFGTQEVLVFENLKKLGYGLHDGQKPMDINHRRLTLEAYSHWHALSFALRHQQPEIFFNILNNLENPYEQIHKTDDMKNLISGTEKLTFDILREKNELHVLKEFEKKVEKGFLTVFEELFEEGKMDKHAVFTHSDCWHNNFMFKYEENHPQNSNPNKVALLDFQQASLNSTTFDLSYHLYYVTPTEDIPNIKQDLEFYHGCLSKKMTELGSDISEIFPFSELVLQWKKYSILGLLMSLIWLPNSMSDREDMLPCLDSFSEDTTRSLVDSMASNIKTKVFDHIVAIVRHNTDNDLA